MGKLLAKGLRQMFRKFCVLERFDIEVERVLSEADSLIVIEDGFLESAAREEAVRVDREGPFLLHYNLSLTINKTRT